MSKYNPEYQQEYQTKRRAAQRAPGVHWLKSGKRWKAYNPHKNSEHYGYYMTKEDAVEAVKLGRRTSKAEDKQKSRGGKMDPDYSPQAQKYLQGAW